MPNNIINGDGNSNQFMQTFETKIFEALGADVDPDALKAIGKIIKANAHTTNGENHAPDAFDNQDAAHAIHDVYAKKANANFSDKPGAEQRAQHMQQAIEVLAHITNNQSLLNVKHIATLEEAQAVIDNKDKPAPDVIESLRESKADNVVYHGSKSEIALSMAMDIGNDGYSPQEAKAILRIANKMLDYQFPDTRDDDPISVTKQDLREISESMKKDFGDRAMDKAHFAAVANLCEQKTIAATSQAPKFQMHNSM